MTIRVRGRFDDVLRFIQALSHNRTLIGVSDTQLALASGPIDARFPVLDTTIHATLYRLRLPLTGKEDHVAANP